MAIIYTCIYVCVYTHVCTLTCIYVEKFVTIIYFTFTAMDVLIHGLLQVINIFVKLALALLSISLEWYRLIWQQIKIISFPQIKLLFKCQLKSVSFKIHLFLLMWKKTYSCRSVNGEHYHGKCWSQRNSITVDYTEMTKGHRSSCQVGTSEKSSHLLSQGYYYPNKSAPAAT